MVIDLTIMDHKPKTWNYKKILQGIRGEYLDKLDYGNDFLYATPEAQHMGKKKKKTLYFNKVKNFCSTKDNVKKKRRQAP